MDVMGKDEKLEIINAYKCELKKYSYYYRRANYWHGQVLEMEYEETGLHGQDYTQERVQGSSDPSKKALRRLDIIEKLEEARNERDRFIKKMAIIECTLGMMKDKQIANVIKNVYCKKITTIYKEADSIPTDVRNLKRRIDKEIYKLPLGTLDKCINMLS